MSAWSILALRKSTRDAVHALARRLIGARAVSPSPAEGELDGRRERHEDGEKQSKLIDCPEHRLSLRLCVACRVMIVIQA